MTASPGQPAEGQLESVDHVALRTALREAGPDLLGYFERRLANHEDAADALADTMLQAWRRVDRLPDDPTHIRMWLFGIAANVLANQRRATRRRTALTDRLRTQLTPNELAPGLDLAEQQAVRDAITRLPADLRELVMLVHWDRLTLAEAAHVLGLNPSTARSRYATARATLRETLAISDVHA